MNPHTGPLTLIIHYDTIPDLLDFFITKNISPRYVQINSSAELSSDHSPVIAIVGSAIIENPPNGLIHNQLTNWQLFREVFNHSTSASISLKIKEDIETATEYLNTSIIIAIRSSTPTKTSISKHEYPHYILNKITEKRRLRRVWQTHRTSDDKRKLNNATRKLTKIIKKYKNDFQETHAPIRCPQGGWARSPIEKANLFANYLSIVFKPHSSNTAPEITIPAFSLPNVSFKPFTSLEVTELIYRLYPGKVPGHDQISNKAIKELPVKGIALISSIFNALLRLEYYPKTWRTSQITLIPKSGKPIHETSSYRQLVFYPLYQNYSKSC